MKISFSGDLYVENSLNCFQVSEDVKSIFHNCDYNFVCFEAPYFNDNLNPYYKVGPNLRQHKDVETLLSYFSHASLANNHSMDYGYDGCKETIKFLKENNVTSTGVSSTYPNMYHPVLLQKDNIKVAVFCLCEAQYGCCKSIYENNGGYGWILNPIVLSLIQEYKSIVDYAIVFAHAGLEDVDCPLPEWRMAYKNLIDFGADAVIASHPHIIQGKEFYKGKSIYYSLGNFFFNGQYSNLRDHNFTSSMILSLNIDVDGISYDEFFVEFSENEIRSLPSSNKIYNKFIQMNRILTNDKEEEYLKYITLILNNCWESEYMYAYSFPIFKNKTKVPLFKRIFNRIMKGYTQRCFLPPVSYNTIFHNLNTDTNRFVTTRYCSMKSNTY